LAFYWQLLERANLRQQLIDYSRDDVDALIGAALRIRNMTKAAPDSA
jgi:hypothetical protein